VHYHTSRNRGKKVVVEVLGEDCDGVIVQDFYASYDGAPERKLKDWAHLLRDARDLVGGRNRLQGLESSTRDSKGYSTMPRRP
jgi:hypothetical protein